MKENYYHFYHVSKFGNFFLKVGKDEFIFHAFKWQTKIILFKSPNKSQIWKQMSLPKITHLYSDPVGGLLGLPLFLKIKVNSSIIFLSLMVCRSTFKRWAPSNLLPGELILCSMALVELSWVVHCATPFQGLSIHRIVKHMHIYMHIKFIIYLFIYLHTHISIYTISVHICTYSLPLRELYYILEDFYILKSQITIYIKKVKMCLSLYTFWLF